MKQKSWPNPDLVGYIHL